MRKAIFWVVTILLISVLSVLLSGVVRDILILPVAKFFWILKGYYGSVNQAIIWGLSIFVVIIISILSLSGGKVSYFSRADRIERTPGDVSQLAFWIKRQNSSLYPRWYVARTLADLAIDLLSKRGTNAERDDQLSGPGFDLPEKSRIYLETALRATPASFHRQLEASNIDQDPEIGSILNFLESYSEKTND